MPRKQSLVLPLLVAAVSIAAFLSIPYFLSRAKTTAAPAAAPSLGGLIVFTDSRAQAREFIGYYHSIATHKVDYDQLTLLVNDWLGFVNPDGFRGDACYQGGCDSQASHGGCGGMEESELAI